MALSVRSARCTSNSIIVFSLLFTSLASCFAGIHVSRLAHAKKASGTMLKLELKALIWNYWLFGYPILIGLWGQLTGGIGVSTSKKKNSRNMCQISGFFISNLVLLGTESYASYDVIFYYLQQTLYRRKRILGCAIVRGWWDNCDLHMAVCICLVIVAAFIILLSFWCVICCLGSFCCRNQVEPESADSDSESNEGQQAVRQPTAAQGVMMQGNPVMMVPMMYNSGPQPVMPWSTVPTMQSNMQAMPTNAIPMMQMTSGTHLPVTGVPVLVPAVGQR